MGIFDTVKNHAIKLKLQSEIVLLDRDIIQCKNKFGIELYDLLYERTKTKSTSSNTNTNKVVGNIIKLSNSNSFISIIENTIFNNNNKEQEQQYYELCCIDITNNKKDKEYKELQLIHSESARERSKPAITNSEIALKAKSRLQDTAIETKLQLDISLIDRSIRQRKEQFGNNIYDILRSTIQSNNLLPNTNTNTTTNTTSATQSQPKQQQSTNKVSKLLGITAAKSIVSKNLSKLNPNDTNNEIDIKNCILQTIHTIDSIVQQKTLKQKDIDQLV